MSIVNPVPLAADQIDTALAVYQRQLRAAQCAVAITEIYSLVIQHQQGLVSANEFLDACAHRAVTTPRLKDGDRCLIHNCVVSSEDPAWITGNSDGSDSGHTGGN